jgi:hypothetical protein
MIAKDLIKKIKNDRNGYVMIQVSNFDDSFFVQGVKSDLIRTIKESFKPDQETGFVIDDCGYFSKHYDYMN